MTKATKAIRRLLLRLVLWGEKHMHRQPGFTTNDPEWNALQNQANSLKNDLRKQIGDQQP